MYRGTISIIKFSEIFLFLFILFSWLKMGGSAPSDHQFDYNHSPLALPFWTRERASVLRNHHLTKGSCVPALPQAWKSNKWVPSFGSKPLSILFPMRSTYSQGEAAFGCVLLCDKSEGVAKVKGRGHSYLPHHLGFVYFPDSLFELWKPWDHRLYLNVIVSDPE